MSQNEVASGGEGLEPLSEGTPNKRGPGEFEQAALGETDSAWITTSGLQW